jgi:beta-lactam-binding protein with PASTA domain
MPDLRGRPLRQALAALAPLGVAVKLAGRGGRVAEQTPSPGETLDVEDGVRLTLASAAAR